MSATPLTPEQQGYLAVLIVQHAAPFEKDANLSKGFAGLQSIVRGLARAFRGSPKPIRFSGAQIPRLPGGQNYSRLVRSGRVQPQVRVTAGDPYGLDLTLTPTAKGGTPMAAGAAIRKAMEAKLQARALMGQGKPPTPDMIRQIQLLGEISENPAAYSGLPESIKRVVADRVRGAVNPRMRFGQRAGTVPAPVARPAPGTPAPGNYRITVATPKVPGTTTQITTGGPAVPVRPAPRSVVK